MNKSFKHLSVGALVLAALNQVHAQYTPPPPIAPFPGFLNEYLRAKDPYANQWDIGGMARFRYESKDGGLGLPPANDFRDKTTATGQNFNDYFSSKVLPHISYTDKWWSFYVEARSSMTVGDDRSITGAGPVPGPAGNGGPEQDGPIDFHQAYFTLGNHKEFPVSLKVGRQELSYGDERLVGAFAWNNIGRVFDAVKLRWQNSWFAAEAFTSKLVLPEDRHLNGWNDYNLFSGLYLTTKKIPKNVAEIYFFARNEDLEVNASDFYAVLPFQVPAPAARDIYTVGARFKSNPGELGNFDYTIEGAFQFGSWQAAAASPELAQQAYAYAVNIGYTFADTFGKPRLGLEYAFASGDSNSKDGQHETFDQLYPTGHKFGGYMDLASWQNVHDVRSMFTLKPTTRLSLAVEGHLFWLANAADSFYNKGGVARSTPLSAVNGGNGFNLNSSYSSFVGSELDVIAGYAVTRFMGLEGGYGHFFTGDYIEQTWSGAAYGSKDADWFYIQAIVKF